MLGFEQDHSVALGLGASFCRALWIIISSSMEERRRGRMEERCQGPVHGPRVGRFCQMMLVNVDPAQLTATT